MQSVDEPFHDAETDLSFSTRIRVVKFLYKRVVSKVVPDCNGFALLHAVIGRENNPHHPIGKSDATLTPIATSSLAFSRAGGRNVHLLRVLSFVLIGRCHNFGVSFKSTNRKPL